MPTKTKRPLKKGDKCWVRIQRKGAPVLAVYVSLAASGNCHFVKFGHELIYVPDGLRVNSQGSGLRGAIFVAKPIPPEAQNVDQVGKKNDSGGRTNEDSR